MNVNGDWIIFVLGLLALIAYLVYALFEETKERLDRAIEEKPHRTFVKNNNRTYRILDEEAYNQFWWGRKPSSRVIYEEWLFEPKATMTSVSLSHGKGDRTLLERLNRELTRSGIVDRVKTHE